MPADQPHTGEADFDDSKWQVVELKGLADRRGGGQVIFPVVSHDPGDPRAKVKV